MPGSAKTHALLALAGAVELGGSSMRGGCARRRARAADTDGPTASTGCLLEGSAWLAVPASPQTATQPAPRATTLSTQPLGACAASKSCGAAALPGRAVRAPHEPRCWGGNNKSQGFSSGDAGVVKKVSLKYLGGGGERCMGARRAAACSRARVCVAQSEPSRTRRARAAEAVVACVRELSGSRRGPRRTRPILG